MTETAAPRSSATTLASSLMIDHSSLRTQLLRGTLGSAGLKGINALLALAVAILLARALGPEGYGVYGFAFSVITLLSVPAHMGLPTLLVREVAKYQFLEDWGMLRGVLRRADQTVLGILVMLMIVASAAAWALSNKGGATELYTFGWALVLLPFLTLGNLRSAALRGLRCVVQGQLPETILRSGFLFALTVATIAFGTLTAPVAMGLHALAAAVAFAIGVILLLRYLPGEARAAPASYETAVWARSLLPLSLLAGLQVINGHTDIVMLGLFTSNAEVGVYRVAVQGAMLVAFPLLAVNMSIAPHISRLYYAGELAPLQNMVTWSARVILLSALPVAVTFIFFGASILDWVFGDAFATGSTALAMLCFGQLVNAAMGSVGLLLSMSGQEQDAVHGIAVAAALNVVLNLALIPSFGIEGAAAATAFSFLVWNILLWRAVRLRLGIESTALGIAASSIARP